MRKTNRDAIIAVLLLSVILTLIPHSKGQSSPGPGGPGRPGRPGGPGRPGRPGGSPSRGPTRPTTSGGKPLPTSPTSMAPGDKIGTAEGEPEEEFSENAKRASVDLLGELCMYKVEALTIEGVDMGYKAMFECPSFPGVKGTGQSKTEDGAVSNAVRDFAEEKIKEILAESGLDG